METERAAKTWKILVAIAIIALFIFVARNILAKKQVGSTPRNTPSDSIVQVQNPETVSRPNSAIDPNTPAPIWTPGEFLTPTTAISTTTQGATTPKTSTPAQTTPSQTPTTPVIPSKPITSNAPVIESLSKTKFGNGETITIIGRNFTENNAVIISIDLPKSFVNIPSAGGTSITFAPRFKISKSIGYNLSKLSAEKKQLAIEKITRIQSSKTGIAGGWYVEATLSIENEYGKSSSVPILVNLLSGI